MRIDYNILWFEDDNSSYEIRKDYVKDIIESYEFNFVEPRHETNGENIDIIDYNKFDLIIADMSLGTVTSMYLLDKIRSKDVYTEVLFYSSNGEKAVRDKLAEYNIDGAYCSGRDIDDFENKATEVIKTLIKKTQNLTNIRGLVMAEVSDLDVKMTEIIEKYCKSSEENKNKLKDYIIPLIEEKTKNSIEQLPTCEKKCTHIWNNKKIDFLQIIHDRDFESYTKARCLNFILKKMKSDIEKFFFNYDKEIIQNRNFLAHCHSEIKDGIETLITNKGEKQYTSEEFKTIRSNILKYSKMFDEVLKKDF